jgi:type I restriction enzyme S subunit
MQLLQHFKSLTLHPKNAQELEGLILQLAIQGKLTVEWRLKNPKVQSAIILLKNIRNEKEKLIQENKIKKDKELPKVKLDELPFQLPDTWSWCRMNDLGIIGSSSRVHQKDWQNEGVPFYRAREIIKLSKFGEVENELFITEELFDKFRINGSIPEKNDIMITGVGTIGIPYIVNEDDRFYFKDASVLIFKNVFKLNSEYLKMFFSCQYWIDDIHKDSMGTTVHTLTISRAKIVPAIVPPLEEQKEIVRVVKILFKELEQLELLTKERISLKEDFVSSALRKLTTQNTQTEWGYLQNQFKDFFTEKSSIKKLREAVLQLAVQGKLTADWRKNNPDSENASELLKRIQKEKAQLIKDKKIKKESPLPVIFKEETPYKLPEGWVWCRMRDVSYSIVPNRDKPKSFTGNITWLTTRNFKLESNKIQHKADDNKLSENELSIYNARLLPIHSVVMSCVGQFGLSAVLEKSYSCNQQLHCFVPLGMVNPFYLDSVIKNSTKILQSASSATTIAYLNKTKCDSLIVPLPPLAEQKTIVEKVKFLMGLCDNLEQEVVYNQELNEQLMKSVLREIFEGDLRDKE